MDWKVELNLPGMNKRATRAEREAMQFQEFLAAVVMPAFEHIASELRKYERETAIRETPASASLTVRLGNDEEIGFRVLRRSLPTAEIPYAEIRTRERRGLRFRKVEALFKDSDTPHNLNDVTSEDIVRVFTKHYRSEPDDASSGPHS